MNVGAALAGPNNDNNPNNPLYKKRMAEQEKARQSMAEQAKARQSISNNANFNPAQSTGGLGHMNFAGKPQIA
jgi:hypothetical protein